jgi:hypothetical protein
VVVLLLLGITGYVLLRMPKVQTKISHQIAHYLSHKLHTKVSVDGVDIELFKMVVLEGLLIEDLHKDTLLYASKFKLDITGMDFKKHILEVKKIHVKDAKFHLKTYLHEKVFNLDFIMEAFASRDTSKQPIWIIKSREIELNNIAFVHRDYNEPPATGGIDYWNLNVTHLNTTIKNFKVVGDTFTGTIKSLSLIENNKFTLSHFEADVILSSEKMQLDNLIIQTPETNVHTNLLFTYKRYQDFLDFNNQVVMYYKFKKCKASIKDISYFAPALTGFDQIAYVSGEVKGKVKQLKGKNLKIWYGKNTLIKGDFSMTGLPDIDNTYMDFTIESLESTKEDIEKIQTYPFTTKERLKLPDNIDLLGKIKFEGKYTGFYYDFVAYGQFATDLGQVSSDINLKLEEGKIKTSYKGHLATNNFNIGRFLGQDPFIGHVTLSVDIEGSGLKRTDVKAAMKGKIDALYANGYTYSNAVLSGEIAKGLFVGDLSVKDKNIDFDFSGNIDIRKDIPVFDFTAQVRTSRLQKLFLANRDTSSSLATNMAIHFSGKTFDTVEGSVSFTETFYEENGKSYTLQKLLLAANTDASGNRAIEMKSDFIDAHILGHYTVEGVRDALQHFAANYLPAIVKNKRFYKKSIDQVNFGVTLKDTKAITELFIPDWQVKTPATVSGSFDPKSNNLLLDGVFPEIKYKANTFKKCTFKSGVEGRGLLFRAGCEQLTIKDNTTINSIQFSAKAQQDSIMLHLQLADKPIEPNKANLQGVLSFESNKKMEFKFLTSDIVIDNVPWEFSPNNKIQVDSSRITIHDFNLNNGSQSLNVEGIVAKNVNDQLKVNFRNFNLSNFNPLSYSKLNGVVNGETVITNIYSGLRFSSNINIMNLAVNGDTLGNASLISLWDNQSKIVGVVANVIKGNIRLIDIKGQYNTRVETNNLDFDITIQKFYLKFLSKYLSEYVTNLRGIGSAELKLRGDLAKPLLTGKVRLQKAGFVYTYLNTQYNLADEFMIAENEILFNQVVLNDINGNIATVSGKIKHDHFKNFRFDLNVMPNNFQSLNTVGSDNSLYYGTAYTTGSVNIRGTTDDLKLKVDLKANKGTKIFIPLSSTDEITQGNFITFVKHDSSSAKVQDAPQIDLSGISLNMDLDVTPESEVQLIFDEKIGGIIKVKGSGNINMNIDTRGDFNMYGTYVIDAGKYTIFNKDFLVERGSSIRWTGSPSDADINLTAIKELKASLYDLIQDSTQRTNVKVLCKIILTNSLQNPTIKFDVEVPNIKDVNTENLVRKYIYTDQDKTNQVFSLLFTGHFKSPNDAAYSTTANGVNNSASELLSNQLSNLASKLSNDVNIGVIYRNASGNNKEQIEVVLSKQFLNDRLIVDGNFGVAGNSTNNAYTTAQSTTNIVGDFNTEYKLVKDGRLRLKGFNRTNVTNNIFNNSNSIYTQGFGIFYREEYNSLKELIERYKNKITKTPATK